MAFTSTLSLQTVEAPFVANTYTSGNQISHQAARLGNGGFAVAYDNLIDFYDSNYNHLGAGYDTVGADIQAMATRDDGLLWVLFRRANAEYVRLYDAAEHRVGEDLSVPGPAYDTYAAITAMAGGGFAYAYGLSNHVYLAIYGADGSKIVRQVDATGGYDHVRLCRLADGGVAVAFDLDSGGDGLALHAAIYNADGSVRSADHVVAGAGSDANYVPQAIAPMIDGGYAILYNYHLFHAFGDDDDQMVLRTFDASGHETDSGPLVLADHDPVNDGNLIALQNGVLVASWAETDNLSGARYFTMLDDTGALAADLPKRVIQNDADLAALGSGLFVGVGTDETGDGSGQGVNALVQELVRTTTGGDESGTFLGDALRDVVHGRGGQDLLLTLEGRDEVYGDAGDDFIRGGADGDALYGGTENDSLYGDEGDDLILGDEGADTVDGGIGNDLLFGGTENDTVSGDDGDDYLYGQEGADRLNGGAGRDLLDGGTSHDVLAGGDGDDSYVLAGLSPIDRIHYVPDEVIEAEGGGVDGVRIAASAGKFGFDSYTLPDNVENMLVTGTDPFALSGNALANALTGNAGANTLNGGKGADTLTGGAGDDRYILGDFNAAAGRYDIVVEAVGGGIDTVEVSGAGNHGYALTAEVENGIVTGRNTAIQLEGNALNNALTSSGGGDTLIGRTGNDTLTGGKGADRFLFQDEGGAAGGWGQDVITDFTRGEDRIVFYANREVDGFDDLRIRNVDGHARILTGHGDTIDLLGVKAGKLTAADFTFYRVAAFTAEPDAAEVRAHHFLGSAGTSVLEHGAWFALA